MNRRNFALTVLLTHWFTSAFATEISSVVSDASYTNTSDRILQNRIDLSYRNHRRDIFYSYEQEEQTAWDFGIDTTYIQGSNIQAQYEGLRAQFMAGRKFSEYFNIESKLGLHQLNHNNSLRTVLIPSIDLAVQFIVNKVISGSLNAQNDLVYQDFVQPGGVSQQLTAVSINPNLTFRWAERWMTQARFTERFLSDENIRSHIDFSTLFGISTGSPWIWIGFGGERLNFFKTVSDYWSPSQFTSFGPRIEAVVPLFNKFSISVGFNGNHFYDKDSDSHGNGYYSSSKLQYGDRNSFNVCVYFIRIESRPASNQWTSEQTGINLSIPF